MNMKKCVAAICVLACILAVFVGCGKQAAAPAEEATTQAPTEAATEVTVTETTALQISEETKLIMELMGNYLNMEPKREFTEYKFGLRTTKWDLPVAMYEDYIYTSDGSIYVDSSCMHSPWGNWGYSSVHYANDLRAIPENSLWLYQKSYEENPQNFNLYMDKNDSSGGHKYRKQNGIRVKEGSYWDTESQQFKYPQTETGYNPVFCGFSILPEENFADYMNAILEDSEQTKAFFALSQEEIVYMHEKQMYEFKTTPWVDFKYPDQPAPEELDRVENEIKEKLENGEIKEPVPHNCYVIQYDIESKYQNVNAPHMISKLFDRPERYEMNQIYPRTRLDDGILHVTLYFDQETRRCVMEKIDATECAGPMIDYLISLGDIQDDGGTYIIQKHYSDDGVEDPKEYQYRNGAVHDYALAVKDPDLYKNKMVYHGWNDEKDYDVVTVDKYKTRYDVKNDMYQILDGNHIVAVVDGFRYIYGKEAHGIDKSNGMEIENKDDYFLVMNQIKMSDVIDSDNKNNEDVGYAVVARPKGVTNQGVVIYAWEEDVLRDVVDHMTFVHTDDPAAA